MRAKLKLAFWWLIALMMMLSPLFMLGGCTSQTQPSPTIKVGGSVFTFLEM